MPTAPPAAASTNRSPNRLTDHLIYCATLSFRYTFKTALTVDHDPDRGDQTRAIGALVEVGIMQRAVLDLFDQYSDGRPILSVLEVDDRTAYAHVWSPTPTPGEHEAHRGPLIPAPGATKRAESHPPLDLPVDENGRALP